MKNWFIPFCLLTLSVPSYAGNLGVPISFDSASILPKGVRNFRYNGVSANANTKYDTHGAAVPLGNALNVGVSYQKLIDAQDTDLEKGVLAGYLASIGKDPSELAGSTTGAVNVKADAHVPIFAWGITRKWTAAIVIPVVKVSTNVDFGFIAADGFQVLADDLVNNGKAFKALDVQTKSNSAILRDLAKKGYKTPESESKTMLGDIRLVNKIQVSNKKNYAIALNADLVLPTGEQVDIDKAIDVAGGDGQFDVGVGATTEFYINPNFTAWLKASYTWQISDNVARRLPESFSTSTSADIDPQTKRDLGDIFYTSFGGALKFGDGYLIRTQYSFQRKGKDQYSGGKFSGDRYGFLSKNTNQVMHSLQLGLGYSTIPKFRRKQFAVPLDVNLNFGKAVKGKNITKDPTVTAEMAVYF
jgi:hypothetical protein